MENLPSRLKTSAGFYIGTTLTTVFLLVMPWLWLGVIALALGALSSTWWEARFLTKTLTPTQAASLGFKTTFTGTILAILIAQIAGTFFAEELWRLENLYRLPPLIATKGLSFDSPETWYIWMAGLVVVSIIAGSIGAPMGIAGTKLFKPTTSSITE
jgi:hypothetical protein